MDVHSLKLLARRPFLSVYARSNVMRLCSSVSCSASTAAAPPLWLSSMAACSVSPGRPAVSSSAARARLGAMQGSSASEVSVGRDGSHSDCLRPGRRRQRPSVHSRAAAERSTLAASALMPFDSPAVLEVYSLQEQDAREAELQEMLRTGSIAGAYSEYGRLLGCSTRPSAMACDGLILGEQLAACCDRSAFSSD